jgi:methionyl-tRNA formyltransferase
MPAAPLKIAILTTQTLHHAHFVREVAKRYPALEVICETKLVAVPFDNRHDYEVARDRYEAERWFDGRRPPLGDFAQVTCAPTVNDELAVGALDRLSPDIVVDFGTGKVKSPVFDLSIPQLLNLHGGDPQHYRGLDSHLWAIYHGDFEGIVTTLHRINPAFDDGDILACRKIPLHRGMPLHELRAANTEVCVALTLAALSELTATGTLASRPQSGKGRYYSAMPTALKELCHRRFEKFTQTVVSQSMGHAS